MSSVIEGGFGRMVWKEWRASRTFALTLIAFGFCLLLSRLTDPAGNGWNTFGLEFTITAIPTLILLGMIATTFAAEQENGTFLLTRSLPLGRGQVIGAKLLTAVGLAAAALGILFVGAWLLGKTMPRSWNPWVAALVTTEMSLWCVLYSFLLRRALLALILGTITASIVNLISSMAIADQSTIPAGVYIARVSVCVALAIANVMASKLWYNDRADEALQWWPTRWRSDSQKLASRSMSVTSGWRGELARVFWLQRRRWQWVFFASAILAVIVTVTESPFVNIVMPIAVLCGAVTFSIRPADRSLVANRPIWPSLHWLFSVVIPAGITVACILIAISTTSRNEPQFGLIASGAFACFAVAQVVSWYSRGGITSIAATIIAGFVTAFLVIAMDALRVPSWVVLWPLTGLALLATLVNHRGWLYGWQGRGFATRKVAAIAVPILLLLGSFAAYRGQSIPEISEQQRAELYPFDRPSVAGVETFNQLSRQYETSRTAGLSPSSLDIGPLQEALQNNSVEFPIWNSTNADRNVVWMASEALGDSWEQAYAASSSEVAAQLLRDATRMREQLLSGEYLTEYHTLGWAERTVKWAAMPSTTSADIVDQIAWMEEHSLTREHSVRMLHAAGILSRRYANVDPRLLPKTDTGEYGKLSFFANLMPWETTRMVRYAESSQAKSMARLNQVWDSIEQGKLLPAVDQQQQAPPVMLLEQWQLSLPSRAVDYLVRELRYERATIVALALVHWKKTRKGSLPSDLDELDLLSGDTKIDPFQGIPFLWCSGMSSDELRRHAPEDVSRPIQPGQAFVWLPLFKAIPHDEGPCTALSRFTVGPRYGRDQPVGTLGELLYLDSATSTPRHIFTRSFPYLWTDLLAIPDVSGQTSVEEADGMPLPSPSVPSPNAG
ncbi:MAG: hypothetical protein AAGA03_10190 [Planctomycetota bacterium]